MQSASCPVVHIAAYYCNLVNGRYYYSAPITGCDTYGAPHHIPLVGSGVGCRAGQADETAISQVLPRRLACAEQGASRQAGWG